MKTHFLVWVLIMAALGSDRLHGTDEDLRKQVEELTQTVRKQQEQIDKQKEILVDHGIGAKTATDYRNTPEWKALHKDVATATPAPWRPTDPIRIAGSGKNYLNLSFDGLFAAVASSVPDMQNIETGGHDPIQRGFTVQNLETVFEGAVDPYFTGQANLVSQIDRAGNTTFEIEEAFLQTTSLPANLQLKAGTYFTSFGRLNPTHPHTWDYADQPLVNGRFMGPDGLRNPGAQISYLTPLPWYSELIFSIQNGSGETAANFRNRGDNNVFFGRPTLDREVRGPQDLLYVPRWANSLDITDEQTVVLGMSAALGPNDTGGASSTQIYGVDAFYKWKSSNAFGGFPFVKWQTEAMFRRFEAGEAGLDTVIPAEVFDDWGFYSQVLWGFYKGWVAGLRGDYLNLDKSSFTADANRDNRWRISPNLTWYPTEFSKIRLQYNHDEIQPGPLVRARSVESVILQFEFLLGSHAAHKF